MTLRLLTAGMGFAVDSKGICKKYSEALEKTLDTIEFIYYNYDMAFLASSAQKHFLRQNEVAFFPRTKASKKETLNTPPLHRA